MRLYDVTIEVIDESDNVVQSLYNGGTVGVSLSMSFNENNLPRGRYVKITRGGSVSEFMNFAEVEVYGNHMPSAHPSISFIPSYQPSNNPSSNPSFLPSSKPSAIPSSNALENIALNKPASLSSEYSPNTYSTSGATNGDTDGVMNQDPYWNGIHTNSEINPWWKVDLEGNKYDF